MNTKRIGLRAVTLLPARLTKTGFSYGMTRWPALEWPPFPPEGRSTSSNIDRTDARAA